MNTRLLPLIASLVALIVLGALAFAIYSSSHPRSGNNFLGNPADMADQLVKYDSSEAFDSGTFKNTSLRRDEPATVMLADARPDSFPREGTWTSPEQSTPFAFTEMIPSWNVNAPRDTGARFHVRVRDAQTGVWSPWLYMGYWGRTLADGTDARVVKFTGGEVQIDTLVLNDPANAYQIRATLQSFDETPANAIPSIRRISVCYSGEVSDPARRAELMPTTQPGDWARDLNIAFRAQKDASERIKSQICSPTSTSMVMAYNGVNLSTLENAGAIYDSEHNIFGNWNRAIARAGEQGLDAWITRFRNWDQVKAAIAQGQPIIASIRFEKGDMPNNPLMQETDGHIIVLRGMTRDGDVIVNDPARKESENGKPNGNGVVYKANELAKAWFDKGGVAYIIRKHSPATTKPTR